MTSLHSQNLHVELVRETGVFDISTLDSITKSNPDQRRGLINLVATLVASSSNDLNDALALWHASENVKAAKILHSLRGSVGNLGAKRFAEATIAIERSLMEDCDLTEACFLTAKVELACTMTHAEKWLSNESKKLR